MGRFQKGQSGNPGGRPKESDEIKELARQHGPAAVTRLVEWMASDNPKASVAAAQALLDRGYGKPPQAIALSGEVEHNYVARMPATCKDLDEWERLYADKLNAH